MLSLKTKQKAPLFFQSFFIGRRILLAALIVFCAQYPNAQFMAITQACSFQVIYIGYFKPILEPWRNKLELVNEYLVLTSCYFLFLYSDGLVLMENPGYPQYDEKIPDLETRDKIGWANIGHLGLLVSINLFLMLAVQFKAIYYKIRVCCHKRKLKRLMQSQAKYAVPDTASTAQPTNHETPEN